MTAAAGADRAPVLNGVKLALILNIYTGSTAVELSVADDLVWNATRLSLLVDSARQADHGHRQHGALLDHLP